jgi:ATP-dependent DNA ligase
MMMPDWRDTLDPAHRATLRRSRMPGWTQPMLATLTDAPFSSPEWIYERKLDGERCLVFRRKRRLQLLSRNRQELTDTYPELVAEVGFTEWTADHRLRHPRFLGLRRDKAAQRVVRETVA